MGSGTLDEVVLNYKGWYTLVFSCGWDELFRNEEFEKYLNKKHIHNLYQFGDSKLVMFLKDLNPRNFLRAIKMYNLLHLEIEKLGKMIKKSKDSYFKTKPWNRVK